ncbi:hypothetical protein HNP24_002440 [Chryseobacterium sediminis]|uniref:EpsG family protein n=1 Tax=Chryseobacterium sediminis TaxID=1679494 RepID=A0ABR6Q0J2_9FLAO|nr:EpsG family protein [Chryseobacterium sediminis]MBB6331490.1 hypothetical protein [Chryseobacterium sediminis]
MMYYLFPILFGLFYSFNRKRFKIDDKVKNIIEKFCIYFSVFIFCGGYMTGSDWVSYEVIYNDFNIDTLSRIDKEPAFYILILLFKSLGFSFFFFLIIMKILVFFIIVRFLKKYSRDRFLLSFSVFLCTNALFIFVDNPLRYMLALGIVVLALDFLIKRKLAYFIMLILLASLFHVSSIIVIVAYFFRIQKLSNVKLFFIYLILVIAWTPKNIITIIDTFPAWLNFLIGSYYRRFIEEQNNSYFSIGWFFTHFLFLFILFNRKKIISSSSFGITVFNMSILYFFLVATVGLIPTFFRVPIYFAVFLYIALAISLDDLFGKNILIKLFFVLYMILANVKNIYSTYVYIPYSSYFIHLFKIDLPYEYRIQYNKDEYFKRTGEAPPEYIPSE